MPANATGGGLHESLLALQSSAGNRAVSELLDLSTAVQRAPRQMVADRPAPEATSLDVTGFYEAEHVDLAKDRFNRITLQLNQAGRHIEGWWQSHQGRGLGNEENIGMSRISGELAWDKAGQLTFNYTRSSDGRLIGEGQLTASHGQVAISLRESGWSHTFERLSNEARISDQAIESMPAESRDLVRAVETAPLDIAEQVNLQMLAQRIAGTVQEYLATGRGTPRHAVASKINKDVADQMGVFAPVQAPLAVRTLRGVLLSNEYKSGTVTRPYWDWLQVIVSAEPAWTPAVQQKLHLTRLGADLSEDAPQNRYRWSFSVVGLAGDVGVGLGGFLGVFEIEKLGPDKWYQQYFTVVGGVSAGLSAGATVGMSTTWNEFQSPFPWTAGDFAGSYVVLEGALGAAVVAGASYSKGRILFYGTGNYPVLDAPADSWTALFGVYIGAEVSAQGGYMWGGKDEAVRDAKSKQEAITAPGSAQSAVSAHFAVDDPSLKPEGRQAVRAMCALHRAELENKLTVVTIHGYASPTGPSRHNQRLSELRARNALQAIRDALGTAFVVPKSNILVEGHGEAAALRQGVKKGTETQAWRLVDIAINGRVVLTLE